MQKITKTDSSVKYAELLLVGLLALVVSVGLYFTNIKLW